MGQSYSCFYRDYATRKQKEVDDKALLCDKRDRGITCLLLKEGEVWWKLLLRLSHKVCRLLSSAALLRKFTSVLKKTRRNIPDRLRTPPCLSLVVDKVRDKAAQKLNRAHPRRPRGSQSGQKRREESLQVQAKEPLGTDSHRTISKNSSRCRLLIGHKKCFLLLCPVGELFLLSSFHEFVHDGYYQSLSGSCTKEMHVVRRLSV